MFTTLQYSPEDDEMTCGELTDKLPYLNQTSSHSACFSCRDKKLKCTGQKSGCDRCRKRNITCRYATASADTGAKRRRGPRAPSPCSTSPSSSSSSRTSPSTKRTATESQEDANSKQPRNQASDTINVRADELMSALVPSTAAGPWDGTLMMSPSAASESVGCDVADTLSPSQMPYPDFTVDDVLNFPFETTPYFTEYNLSGSKDRWQESRTTLADCNPTTPVNQPNGQTQLLLETKVSQRWPSDFQIREQCDSPSSSGGPSLGTSPSTRIDFASASLPACSCRDMALQILETIQPQRKRKPTHAILQQLYFTKGIISQCQSIISCATCIKLSGLMVLVGVISENLMDVLEAVTLDWESKNWLADADLEQSVHAWNANAGSTKALNYNCLLEDYKVDTAEERSALIGCLLLFQINRLDEILIRLQKNAITADWESHLIILQPVFQRLRLIKNKL